MNSIEQGVLGQLVVLRETSGGRAGGGGIPDTAAAGRGNRQAWLREMERIQLGAWFQSFEVSPSLQVGRREDARTQPQAQARAPQHATHSQPHQRASTSPWALRMHVSRGESVPHAYAPRPESHDMRSVPHTSVSSEHALDGSRGAPSTNESGGNSLVHSASAFAAYASAPAQEVASAAGVKEGGGAGARNTATGGQAGAKTALAHTPPPLAAFQPLHAVVPIRAVASGMSLTALPALKDGPPTASWVPLQDRSGFRAQAADALSRSDTTGALRWVDSAQAAATGTRMHAQWTENGVQLWLGMDGSASAMEARVQAVVYSLQRLLRDQGQRLSTVVCNGRVVYDASSPWTGASRSPHEFTDIFSRFVQARGQAESIVIASSNKEIS